MAGIASFILKRGLRNAIYISRVDLDFCESYAQMFGAKLPKMDAVEDLFRKLGAMGIEGVDLWCSSAS